MPAQCRRDRFVIEDVAMGRLNLTAQPVLYLSLCLPESTTKGRRRQTDVLRGVLERTRGDLTTAVRQEKMQAALRRVEERLG